MDELAVFAAFGLAPVGMAAILLLLWNLLGAPYRLYNEISAKREAIQQQLTEISTKRPPKNRDALIRVFTELGQRATNLARMRTEYNEVRHIPVPSTRALAQSIKQAISLYEEAQLEAAKEINIVGGDLSRSLRLLTHEIDLRIAMASLSRHR